MKSYIDDAWELEGFVSQLDAKPSMKFGFIGLGQAGGKMVDAFASVKHNGKTIYPCMVINSNVGDMKVLKNIPTEYRLGLEGYEEGVGKDPQVGERAFLENAKPIFMKIMKLMEDRDIIFVASSLSGGTGSGSVNALINAISSSMYVPVISIAAIGRPLEVESLNAYNALADLVPKLSSHVEDSSLRLLEGLILLDNQKIWEDHSQEPESNLTWDYYSNYKLASVLHEWNVLVSLGSDMVLDSADLRNHVLLNGGCLTFAKKKIELVDGMLPENLVFEIINTYKGRNILANGFDYSKDLRTMAMVIVMPREKKDILNQDTLEQIRSKFNDEIPNVPFYPGFVTSGNQKHAIVYTVASLSGLPVRAKGLRQEYTELKDIRLQREAAFSGFDMGGKIQSESKSRVAVGKKPVVAKNPFDSVVSEVKVRKNPFD